MIALKAIYLKSGFLQVLIINQEWKGVLRCSKRNATLEEAQM